MFFLTHASFLHMNKLTGTSWSLEGLIFQRFADTFICNRKRVALMIRKLDQSPHTTEKTTCSSIREKKHSRSFVFFNSSYNKNVQEARHLRSMRLRHTSLEPEDGYRPLINPLYTPWRTYIDFWKGIWPVRIHSISKERRRYKGSRCSSVLLSSISEQPKPIKGGRVSWKRWDLP